MAVSDKEKVCACARVVTSLPGIINFSKLHQVLPGPSTQWDGAVKAKLLGSQQWYLHPEEGAPPESSLWSQVKACLGGDQAHSGCKWEVNLDLFDQRITIHIWKFRFIFLLYKQIKSGLSTLQSQICNISHCYGQLFFHSLGSREAVGKFFHCILVVWGLGFSGFFLLVCVGSLRLFSTWYFSDFLIFFCFGLVFGV